MISCPPPWKWSVHASSDSWLQFHQFPCADKSVNPNNEYAWYPSHIPLFSLPSNNIKGWDLHPVTASFCTLHILNRAIYVFERMNTRFYSENIFLKYTRYIPGISTGRVYTWYIQGIYQDNKFWGFQMPVWLGLFQYRDSAASAGRAQSTMPDWGKGSACKYRPSCTAREQETGPVCAARAWPLRSAAPTAIAQWHIVRSDMA